MAQDIAWDENSKLSKVPPVDESLESTAAASEASLLEPQESATIVGLLQYRKGDK